jgi:hypothetical protein
LFKDSIGWIEMKGLGTEEDVKGKQSQAKDVSTTPEGATPE